VEVLLQREVSLQQVLDPRRCPNQKRQLILVANHFESQPRRLNPAADRPRRDLPQTRVICPLAEQNYLVTQTQTRYILRVAMRCSAVHASFSVASFFQPLWSSKGRWEHEVQPSTSIADGDRQGSSSSIASAWPVPSQAAAGVASLAILYASHTACVVNLSRTINITRHLNTRKAWKTSFLTTSMGTLLANCAGLNFYRAWPCILPRKRLRILHEKKQPIAGRSMVTARKYYSSKQ
jgi:hypothetical protein